MAFNHQLQISSLRRPIIPHFENGFVLNEKFRVERLIGYGGYGQIFKAIDLRYNIQVAIKFTPSTLEPFRMILEQKVLLALNDTEHSPFLISSGSCGNFLFIVMELLGRNLMDLRRSRCNNHFTVGTTLRIGLQCFEGLKAIHDVGYLHRDLKPSNICIGAKGNQKRTIYILDFGMARKFRHSDGRIRHGRHYAGFRGTSRYASLTTHYKREQGPVDDLWSLLYSIIEIGEGALPWRLVSDATILINSKKKTKIVNMCRNLPRGIADIEIHLETLKFDDIPDYELLKYILEENMPSNVSEETPYDWEE